MGFDYQCSIQKWQHTDISLLNWSASYYWHYFIWCSVFCPLTPGLLAFKWPLWAAWPPCLQVSASALTSLTHMTNSPLGSAQPPPPSSRPPPRRRCRDAGGGEMGREGWVCVGGGGGGGRGVKMRWPHRSLCLSDDTDKNALAFTEEVKALWSLRLILHLKWIWPWKSNHIMDTAGSKQINILKIWKYISTECIKELLHCIP